MGTTHAELLREHEPRAVQLRLALPRRRQHASDAILGGIDGCITTFAVVAGSLGAGFPGVVAVVLGFANLIADGFSMAVSSYESLKLQGELRAKHRRTEERHIAEVPEGEREEVRQIFRGKGFSGSMLEDIVRHVCSDRELWLETMLTEELGLDKAPPHALRSAAVTFAAFVLVGSVPLLPLLIPGWSRELQVAGSVALAGAVFFGIGAAKGILLGRPLLRAGLATLATGGSAAALAFVVAAWVGRMTGAA